MVKVRFSFISKGQNFSAWCHSVWRCCSSVLRTLINIWMNWKKEENQYTGIGVQDFSAERG